MIHFNCDMCGKSITPGDDSRYVVKIEVYAACDSLETDGDFDEELIDDIDDDDDDDEVDSFDSEEMEDVEYKTFRFDLCQKCYNKYLQDPLSLNAIRRGRFSEN